MDEREVDTKDLVGMGGVGLGLVGGNVLNFKRYVCCTRGKFAPMLNVDAETLQGAARVGWDGSLPMGGWELDSGAIYFQF